jgi:hypothetical protein
MDKSIPGYKVTLRCSRERSEVTAGDRFEISERVEYCAIKCATLTPHLCSPSPASFGIEVILVLGLQHKGNASQSMNRETLVIVSV